MPLPWANAFPILGSRLVSDFRGDFNAMLDAIARQFTGPEEPPQRFPGMFWVDTSVTPRLLKQRKSDDTGWVTRARIDTDYGGVLPLGGGTMEGAINMNGFGVTNLPLGSGNSAVRYADLTPYAKLDGSTPFTGVPTFPLDPLTAAQAARKAYVDAKAVAGGSFVGQIAMTVAPTAADHVMRKSDVENLIGTHNHSGSGGQGVKVAGSNLSSGTQVSGIPLIADGSGGVTWSKLSAGFLASSWGRIAGNGSIVQTGSGSWTVSRTSAGVYEVTVTTTLSGPAAIVTPDAPSDPSFRGDAEILSGTSPYVIRFILRKFNGLTFIPADCAFFFLIL